MVKRYALIGGRVDEAVDHSHSCHVIYVREDDYAALEAKAFRAGVYAGELQMKINALESENTRLQEELKAMSEAFELLRLVSIGGAQESALKTGD